MYSLCLWTARDFRKFPSSLFSVPPDVLLAMYTVLDSFSAPLVKTHWFRWSARDSIRLPPVLAVFCHDVRYGYDRIGRHS